MKFILLFWISIFSGLQLIAQENQQDVLYLKDGSVLRGTIVERHQDSILKIQIIGNNILVVKADEISEINKENKTGTYIPRSNGIYNVTSIGISTGMDEYANLMGGLEIGSILGYRFENRIQTGAGASIVYQSQPLFNVFGDIRFDFSKRRITNFAYLDVGYCRAVFLSDSWIDEEITPGFGYLTELGLGIRSNSSVSKSGFAISLGYRFQSFKIIYTEINAESKRIETYLQGRFVLKMGFAF